MIAREGSAPSHAGPDPEPSSQGLQGPHATPTDDKQPRRRHFLLLLRTYLEQAQNEGVGYVGKRLDAGDVAGKVIKRHVRQPGNTSLQAPGRLHHRRPGIQ